MNNIVLDKYRHIHFVGIGGVSMYLLAIYCKQCGIDVSGSDIAESKYTRICKSKGIIVTLGHKRKNVHGADLVVHTSAVNDSNIEILEAKKRRIEVIDRAELLYCICKRFKYVIGVAGTHGKTTTCAMIYHILKQSGKDVSCHIGADIEEAQMKPSDEYLVLECCEYNRSFLRLYYNIAVVLNIDNDHLDCYQNMYNLRNAFKTFLKRAKTRFVYDNKSTSCIKVRSKHIKTASVLANNKFMYNGKKYVLDNVYGQHNINNATVAIGICQDLGVSYTRIYRALKSFKPAGRRCQLLGRVGNIDIITDYAHHPSEIESFCNGLKSKYTNAYIVFQPHTYSRTKLLIHEFVKLFSGIDNLVIYKEYSARETKSQGFSAKQLAEYLDNARYIKNYRSVEKWIKNIDLVAEKSCVAFVGAGNINEIGVRLIENMKI